MRTLITCLFFPFLLLAQSPTMSVRTMADVDQIQKIVRTTDYTHSKVLKNFPITEIKGELYLSFLGKVVHQNELPAGVIIGEGHGTIRSVRIALDQLHLLSELPGITHLELANSIKPELFDVNFDTGADSVHLGIDLPQAYTGKNVILGFNDWGFDYTHPMFYDTLLETTRIIGVWDQFKKAGPHPNHYEYGAEYSDAQSILAAETDTTNQLSHSTHGTHTAGIAGGSGAGVISKGMAFEAEYLFTTILLDEAAVIDSWNWMLEKANEAGKNLVVNMSWGLYWMGTPDGTSLLSQAISELTDQGVLFVCSAGNNGNVNFHIAHHFSNDEIKSKVNFFPYSQHDSLWGQSLHAWGDVGKSFEMKIEVSGVNGTVSSPYYATTMNGYTEDILTYNNDLDTIWLRISGQESHPQNAKPTLRIQVKNTNSGLTVFMTSKATEGTVHYWNVIDLTTNGGNTGMPFMISGQGTIGGDPYYGVSEPANASECITVAAHAPSYYTQNGTLIYGNRAAFSSIGPRLDGAMKPDVSAPGSNILSSINSFTDDNYSASTTTNFDGRNYDFGRLSGTSMSAPVVAGIAALIWEANPYLTPLQIKYIIKTTAKEDPKTGVLPAEGDREWGHRKIDAMAAVKAAIGFVGLQEIEEDSSHWNVYPNPARSNLQLSGIQHVQEVHLITMEGTSIPLDPTVDSWSIEGLTPGIYLFRLIANDRVYQKKLIVQ